MLLGLSAILQLNENEIPITIIGSLQPLVKQLVKLTTEILQLREKDETVDENDQAEEEATVETRVDINHELQKHINQEDDDDDEDDEDYDDFA